MPIAKDQVVGIQYTLKDDAGNILDQSPEGNPLEYLQGHANIIPGLEDALEGKDSGDKVAVSIAPAEAYGEHQAALVQKLPRQMFQGVDDIQPGMQFTGQDQQGNPVMLTVKSVEEEQVEVDGNHPLAGQTLHFDVEIASVREATAEELEQGHIARKHECCGGHGDEGCCGDKHDDDHECCGGEGHDDGHECCGGKDHKH